MDEAKMTKWPDTIEIMARWTARSEPRKSCAARCSRFLAAFQDLLAEPGEWRSHGGTRQVQGVDPDSVDKHLEESLSSSSSVPIEDLGLFGPFHFKTNAGFNKVDVRCGAWTPHLRWANSVSVQIVGPSREQTSVNQATVRALVACFEPDFAEAFSGLGSSRRAANKFPMPIVDWMVYLADTMIPPEELPMVHAVERVGTGTLVILKKERLHLDRPEDLALVEAVEPVIRRYQKPPPKTPTVPGHGTRQ